jgi:hypothetical protein
MPSVSCNGARSTAPRLIPLGQCNELETLVRGLLAPAILLDYLRFFVLFEDDGTTLVKKIAGYHQFHAVRAAIAQVVIASRPGGSQKGGVVWHTQGSGKSITMTCFAARVMREAAMENPTIVVITDRNDLDGQLLASSRLPMVCCVNSRCRPAPGRTCVPNSATDRRAASSSPPSRNSCPAMMKIPTPYCPTAITSW